MLMRILALAIMVWAFVCPSKVFAQEAPCATPEAFNGFWGAGQVQVSEHVAGVPVLATARFSYRQIRFSPCVGGMPALAPGVGAASITLAIPLINNRRGGWLLQIAAHGQGSQRSNEPVSGLVTGAPAMAGHLNIWETPLPLIQLTGAASAAIVPQSSDVPLSIAYIGGTRVYVLYVKRAQANVGMMVGGSNGGMNIVPSFALRVGDLSIWSHKVAIGLELRSPIEFFGGPIPTRWRLWSALTITIEKPNESKTGRAAAPQSRPGSFDLVHSAPQAAPPVQTAWETTL